MERLRLSRNDLPGGRQWSALVCFLLLSRVSLYAIGVEEAYRAIPHRTPFDVTQVKMSPTDAAVLQEFFRLVNFAIVERVQAMTWFQSNEKRDVAFPGYQRSTDGLIEQLEALTMPKALNAVRRDVIDALKDQRAYF